MVINKLFGGSIDLTSKALDLLSDRQSVIQSNIANMDTPGYKAKDIPFAEVMKSAANNQGNLQRTNPKHMPAQQIEATNNGKTHQTKGPVDIDEQMLKLSENQLRYEVATKIISKKFESLKFIIEEGGK